MPPMASRHQRRHAGFLPTLDGGAIRHQERCQLGIAAFAGMHQRCPAIGVGSVDLGTCVEQGSCRLEIALAAGHQQRGVERQALEIGSAGGGELLRQARRRGRDLEWARLPAKCYRTFHFVWNQLTGPSMSPPPVLEAAYEELLLNAMSMLLAPALTDGSDRFDLGSALIQRACEIIKAQAAEPIRIADIAIALGVSTRHLQAGFRRYLNTTPQRFLSDCRLERARSMLQLSLPHETVTQIAFECGFGHLGEFSMRYRSRFGESPSETFRRARVVG